MAVKQEFKKRMNEIMLTLMLDELGDAAQPGLRLDAVERIFNTTWQHSSLKYIDQDRFLLAVLGSVFA